MDVFNFIWCSLIISAILINSWFIGKKVSLLIFNEEKDFTLVLGFVTLLAAFHVAALPFLYINAKFEPIYMLFIGFFVVLLIFAIVDFIKNIKKIKLKKYNLIVLITAISYGIYLFIFSVPALDSWLFLPLSQISSETGYIYLSHQSTPYTNWIHAYDSYYLFLNFFAELSNIDPTFFIITFLKFLEGFLVVYSIAFFTKLIFKNYQLAFYLCFSGILFWIPILTNSTIPNQAYPAVFMTQMSPTGTGLIYHIVLPLLIVFHKYKSSIKDPHIVLLIITIFAFACSSSALYMIPFYIVALIIYDLLVSKTSRVKTYLPSLYFVALEALIFLNSYSLIVIVAAAIIGFLIVWLAWQKIGKKLDFAFAFLIITIFLVATIGLFLYKELNLLTIIQEANKSITYPIIFALGVVYFWKHNRETAYFIMICFIVFSNPISMKIWSTTPVEQTYHRVEMISSLYLFYIAGVIKVVDYLIKKNWQKILFYSALTVCFLIYGLNTTWSSNNNAAMSIRSTEGYDNFYEYKMLYPEVYNLGAYPYNPYAYIKAPNTNVSAGEPAFHGVVGMNPTLVKFDEISECHSNCYIIQQNNQQIPWSYTKVYSYGDYNLLYKS